MPQKVDLYRIFIASPGDCGEERESIRSATRAWNYGNSVTNRIHLHAVGYDTHSLPQYGVHPQELINKNVLDTCDITIVIFKTRLGTPDPNRKEPYPIVEEMKYALDNGQKVYIYFFDGFLDSKIADEENEEFIKLKEFQERIQNHRLGIYSTFKSSYELREKFLIHLNQIMNDFSDGIDESSIGVYSSIKNIDSGLILSHGSNSDGEWKRYSDGRQICNATKTIDMPIINKHSFIYPVPFENKPIVNVYDQHGKSLNKLITKVDLDLFVMDFTDQVELYEPFEVEYLSRGEWM